MLLILFTIESLLTTFLIGYFQYGEFKWSLIFIFIGFFFAYFILWLIFLAVVIMFHRRNRAVVKPKWFYNINIRWACQLMRVFYNVTTKYEVKKALPEDGKYLLVVNHQSNLDPIVSMARLGKWRLAYIMKKEIRNIPVAGRWLHASGYFYIDRDDDRAALKTIVQVINRVKAGYPVGVYPEGTRSKGPEMGEFRNGIFKAAQKAGAAIVVMVVDGTYKVKHRFPFKHTKVLIRICDVLPYEEIKDMHTNDIGDKVKAIMQENLDDARSKYKWLN